MLEPGGRDPCSATDHSRAGDRGSRLAVQRLVSHTRSVRLCRWNNHRTMGCPDPLRERHPDGHLLDRVCRTGHRRQNRGPFGLDRNGRRQYLRRPRWIHGYRASRFCHVFDIGSVRRSPILLRLRLRCGFRPVVARIVRELGGCSIMFSHPRIDQSIRATVLLPATSIGIDTVGTDSSHVETTLRRSTGAVKDLSEDNSHHTARR